MNGKRLALVHERRKRDWRQIDVARRLGVTTSHYGMIEQGVRNPSLSVSLAIEALFERPIGELFGDARPAKEVDKERTAKCSG